MMKVTKAVFDNVLDVKFNKNNKLLALIYKNKVDIFDITNQSSEKQMLPLHDMYEKILAFKFRENG